MANEEIHIVKSTTRTVLALAVGLQHTTFFFLLVSRLQPHFVAVNGGVFWW